MRATKGRSKLRNLGNEGRLEYALQAFALHNSYLQLTLPLVHKSVHKTMPRSMILP